MKIEKWLKENTSALGGKTVVLSGSTGGLGRELCFYLIGLGARLITLDRNPEKAEKLKADILKKYPAAEISSYFCDMEKLDEVMCAAEELKKEKIDALILNSAAYAIPKRETKEGYNNVFTINFISPYYLLKALLPALRKRSGRAVIVGSIAHNYSKTDPEDIDFGSKNSSALIYGNSKRYLMLSGYKLFGNEDSASLAVVHPGISFTGITNHYPKLIFALIKHPMKLIFMSPKKASLSILWGLFKKTEFGFWIGPRAFDIWGRPKLKKLRSFRKEEAENVFFAAEEIYEKIERMKKNELGKDF